MGWTGGWARESHTVRAVRTFSGVQQDLTNDLTRLGGMGGET